MFITRKVSSTGDVPTNHQLFKKLDINISSCRYLWLKIWKGEQMSFPFWRLYYNKNEGAYVHFKKKVFLKPNKIYLIPPYTPFSNGIVNQTIPEQSRYFFKCGIIQTEKEEQQRIEEDCILHFFIHFTLGLEYDNVLPTIFEIDLEDYSRLLLEKIFSNILAVPSKNIDKSISLIIHALIVNAVATLPPQVWEPKNIDNRLQNILIFIQENIDKKITNPSLAEQFNISPSQLIYLFKKYTKKSPIKYLLDYRLEVVCDYLLHSEHTLEEIAFKCGFADRFHMSKLFKKKFSTPPVTFRKQMNYF